MKYVFSAGYIGIKNNKTIAIMSNHSRKGTGWPKAGAHA
jgi:hypothetical protein